MPAVLAEQLPPLVPTYLHELLSIGQALLNITHEDPTFPMQVIAAEQFDQGLPVVDVVLWLEAVLVHPVLLRHLDFWVADQGLAEN